MTTFEDFTVFPRGCEVLMAGRIETCPRCGRNGIESRENDRACFVHSQETDVRGDGMRVEPVDRCVMSEDEIAF
jgi:hypothetical protein